MRLPVLHGLIRRLLVNFRVDAPVMARYLPAPFRPKLRTGYAVAGICLIRLEQMRPAGLPSFCGLSARTPRTASRSNGRNLREHGTRGVFIPRRDTGSRLDHWAGVASSRASTTSPTSPSRMTAQG